MKKTLFVFITVICCLLYAAACAAPAMTDGTLTAWIAENGYLDWQTEDGTVLQIPIAMEDIFSIRDGKVICLAKDQRVLSVQKEGYQALENAAPESLKDQRIRLEEGKLSFDGVVFSEEAGYAVTDGSWLYYTETLDGICRINVRSIRETGTPVAAGSRDACALSMSGRAVPEALSLTVTREALTLTGSDHQVIVMNLLTGVVTEYPGTEEEKTAAACMICDTLYRYTLSEDQKWMFESSTALTPLTLPMAMPAPAPTPVPTPAPTSKTTEKATSLIDSDGTIHFGASGSTVRKIQKRLAELGYPTGNADGIYGDQTQLAINLFCDAIHVREHNYITARIQRKLFAEDAPAYDPYLPLKKGDQGVSVLYMQVRLKELGYDPVKLDGIYGELTVAAVAMFQKDYGIPMEEKEIPGEVASHEMLEKLFAPELTPTTVPSPTPAPDYVTPTDLQ